MAEPDVVAVVDLLSHGPHRYETGRKQVTLALGGLYIASTTMQEKPKLVWETETGYGRYYIPITALHADIKRLLTASMANDGGDRFISQVTVGIDLLEIVSVTENASQAAVERLTVGNKSTSWVRFLEGPFKDFVRFERHEIDEWFENGAIFVSIKNPYKRIDTTTVSQHISVKVHGEVVAESNAAVLLNETGQLEAYYIPATSIKNWGAVEKSHLRTVCPYKGEASYLSITVQGKKYENLIWFYQYPTHESAAVEGLISFHRKNEVKISVDGVCL